MRTESLRLALPWLDAWGRQSLPTVTSRGTNEPYRRRFGHFAAWRNPTLDSGVTARYNVPGAEKESIEPCHQGMEE
jgi:hypothetical protein